MISIIVPVYKVEKYLDNCVRSILTQTYSDFELILVDDGSPDNCPKICDDYATNDDRIVVLHKQNGGLSDARNAGLKIAKGSFVTFIDSDDYVANDYLETMMAMQQKYDVDIVVVGIETFLEGENPRINNNNKEYVYSGIEALEKMLYQNNLDSSACAMLLPIEIAKKYPFPFRKYHEDEFTTYKYYVSVEKVAVTTKPLYYYLQRKGSIMHTFGQANIDELNAADNYVNFCKEQYPDLVSAAESKKFSDYCQVFLSNRNIDKINHLEYLRICTYIDEVKNKIFKDRKCRIKNRIAALIIIIFGLNGLAVFNRIILLKNKI